MLSFPPGGVSSAQGKITRKDVSPMYNEDEQSQNKRLNVSLGSLK